MVIKMYIRPTKLLENNTAIANYDSKGRLCGGSQSLD